MFARMFLVPVHNLCVHVYPEHVFACGCVCFCVCMYEYTVHIHVMWVYTNILPILSHR